MEVDTNNIRPPTRNFTYFFSLKSFSTSPKDTQKRVVLTCNSGGRNTRVLTKYSDCGAKYMRGMRASDGKSRSSKLCDRDQITDIARSHTAHSFCWKKDVFDK